MSQITKDMIIADILEKNPETVQLFKSIGMHCLGCAMASGETLDEACSVHGVNSDAFLETINALVGAQAQ